MTALVMELVEGDDLSLRIARGAIPLDEALPIAKQIAEALEAAHATWVLTRQEPVTLQPVRFAFVPTAAQALAINGNDQRPRPVRRRHAPRLCGGPGGTADGPGDRCA